MNIYLKQLTRNKTEPLRRSSNTLTAAICAQKASAPFFAPAFLNVASSERRQIAIKNAQAELTSLNQPPFSFGLSSVGSSGPVRKIQKEGKRAKGEICMFIHRQSTSACVRRKILAEQVESNDRLVFFFFDEDRILESLDCFQNIH